MTKTSISITTLFIASIFLSACQSGGTTTSSVTPTPATTVATQGVTVAGVTSSDILAVANGGVDWSGQGGPFPTTISGGDGFQADPVNDASFATLINSVRTAAGASPLSYDARLDAAAQRHSDDMFASGVLSHTGSDGSSIGDRATAAGYVWTRIGENIAQGQGNENLAINGWISSPGHQANNVDPDFEDFGLARTGTGSNTYWTLLLGAQ